MNKNLENIFSYIADVLKINDKSIYDYKKYDVLIELNDFIEKYKDISNEIDIDTINILNNSSILKLKYKKEEDYLKKYPIINDRLKNYISLDDNNEIIISEESYALLKYNNYLLEYNNIKKNNDYINNYNKIYKELYNLNKRIKDNEEKIEIILATNLLYWKNNNGDVIKRHILECNLDLDVDSINDIITLSISSDKFKGFVTDFLNEKNYSVKSKTELDDLVIQSNLLISSADLSVDELNNKINEYVNYISYNNSIKDDYFNEKETENNITYLFKDKTIFYRKKTLRLWIDDALSIVNYCKENEINNNLLKTLDIDFSNEEEVNSILYDKNSDINEEVLFPLSSNDEQYEIVNKVNKSNIVLVQGPPGTGKSHTIANLLSHYIAQGKKVIVTSEKSKALEVLRDKIPTSIRSLSLALLSSKGIDKDLEFSINNILSKQKDEEALKKSLINIKKLEKKLDRIKECKAQNQKEIIEIMSKDTINYKNKLIGIIDNITDGELHLEDIAKYLEDKREYRYIPVEDIENFDYKDIDKMLENLDDIRDEIKNNNYALSTEVPINNLLLDNQIEMSIKEGIRFHNYCIKNESLKSAIIESKLNSEIINELTNKINNLNTLYEFFSKKWLIDKLEWKVFFDNLEKLRDEIISKEKLIYEVESNKLDYNLEYDSNNLEVYHNIICNILSLFNERKNITLINKIKLSNYLNKLNNFKLNNNYLTKDLSFETFKNIESQLNYTIFVNNIKNKLNKILEKDILDIFNIQAFEFGKYEKRIIDTLNEIINYNKTIKDIDNDLAKIINNKLFNISYINDSEETILNVIDDLNYFITVNSNTSKQHEFSNILREFYKDYNLQNLNKLILSIENKNLDEYIINKERLLNEINIINKYNNIRKNYSLIFSDKPIFIRNYIYNYDNVEKSFVKDNIDKILKYHYVEKFYLVLEKKQNIKKLYETRNGLIQKEKKIIEELISEKGWYYQNKQMTPLISSSLSKWMSLKKKLGSGTGKTAHKIINEMQKEMQIAKNSIPVWIMPLDKLIEQYPFSEKPPFDVLIMDESSQSSIYSISALTRAKKIIIVGDDKQISPTTSFTSVDGVEELKNKYLRNNQWKEQLSKDTSIYDFIGMICNRSKVVLTEHFRCLREIIEFSNRYYYNGQINPLKIRSKENTIDKPIMTIYVDGRVKKYGNQPYNAKELEKVIELLRNISNDEKYKNKTIGIITLQRSDKFVQRLIEKIWSTFGDKFATDRHIKVGDTASFQGDERDVIILCMLISVVDENGDENIIRSLTTKEYERIYNVAASRAKEQMILIHSVTLDNLKENCCRYKLLNYCLNYDKEEQKQIEAKFESNFEKEVYKDLTAKGLKLIPQFKVGNYRIDFVIKNDNDQNIALECDGDSYHNIDNLEDDLNRQSVLERCGWKFIRVRASEYFYDREKSINRILEEINNILDRNYSNLNINYDLNDILNFDENSILKEVEEEIAKEENNVEVKKKYESQNNDETDSSLNSNSKKEIIDSIPKIDNQNLEYKTINESGITKNSYRFLTLYCEGVSIEDISKYYVSSIGEVKKALELSLSIYKKDNLDEAAKIFKEKFKGSQKYNSIYENYKKYKENNL